MKTAIVPATELTTATLKAEHYTGPYKVSFKHVPGHSPVDHVAGELVGEAERRLKQPTYANRASAHRGGLRALQSARMHFQELSKRAPATFGAYSHTMPRVEIVVERV